MAKYYKDWYGATAKVVERKDGTAALTVCAGMDRKTTAHKNLASAVASMRRQGEGWREQSQRNN